MRIGLIVAASLFLAVLVAGEAGAAKPRKPCDPRDSRTVKINPQVRVYRARTDLVFACYRTSGRTRFLGYPGPTVPDGWQSLSIIRLAGRFVAFDAGSGCDRYYGDCKARVAVLDVRTGRIRHDLAVADIRLPGEPESQLAVLSDLELRRNGSAALIIGPNEARELEVWKLDSQGRVRLDHGPDVERGSLAINADWVYWRRGGNAFSSPFR